MQNYNVTTLQNYIYVMLPRSKSHEQGVINK